MKKFSFITIICFLMIFIMSICGACKDDYYYGQLIGKCEITEAYINSDGGLELKYNLYTTIDLDPADTELLNGHINEFYPKYNVSRIEYKGKQYDIVRDDKTNQYSGFDINFYKRHPYKKKCVKKNWKDLEAQKKNIYKYSGLYCFWGLNSLSNVLPQDTLKENETVHVVFELYFTNAYGYYNDGHTCNFDMNIPVKFNPFTDKKQFKIK